MIERFLESILIWFTIPTCLSDYDEHLDREMIKALNGEPKFANHSKFKCTMNGIEFWIGNEYYGFECTKTGTRPSRRTILIFYKKMTEAILKETK